MDLAQGFLFDRYSVEERIGTGGMATVYRVRHVQLGTPHALKVLTVESRSIRTRMLQEGRIQARLRHPNVISVTDVVEVEGALGLLMEYVRGPSLDRVLEGGPLSIADLDAIAPGVLAGCAAAHREHVVHRDLKPANVLMAVHRDTLVPKVADFGLVKMFGEQGSGAQTRTGSTMGTPEYMSPEQIRDASDVDHRTDIFALGAMFWELATGVRAFAAADNYEVFRRITQGDVTPVSSLRPDLPERMVKAIEAALVVDRNARVASCEALWEVWRGEPQVPLEAAAAGARFSGAFLARIESLSLPPVTASSTSSGGSDSPATWGETHAPPSLGELAPASGGRSRSVSVPVRVLLPVALLAGLCLAALGAVGLGWLVWREASVSVDIDASADTPRAGGLDPLVPAEPPVPSGSPDPPGPEEAGAVAPDAASEPEAPPPEPAPRVAVPAPRRPTSEPSPAPPTPAPEPRPAPAATGQVLVTGDAAWVRLVPAAGGTAVPVPGAVAAGRYVVEAPDASGKVTRFGVVDVPAGGEVTLSCRTAIRNCR